MAATARAVDLTGVKEGGVFKPRRKPEGDYRAKIMKADDHQPKDKDKGMGWVLTIQVEGDARSTYPYYLNGAEKERWKIGAICRAAGLNVKNTRIKFDPNRLVNKWIGIALADDEYEGRPKSTIDDVFPESEVGANADEDVPEEDEVDVEDEEVEEEEVEETPPPRRRRTTPPTKRVAKAPVEEPEDDEEEEEEEEPPPPPRRRRKPVPEPEEEDEEEEEEPAPPPRRTRKATTAPVKRTRPKPAPPADDEDDDLDEIDTDDLDEG